MVPYYSWSHMKTCVRRFERALVATFIVGLSMAWGIAPAGATATRPHLLAQAAIVPLTRSGNGVLPLSFRVAGANSDGATVSITLFRALKSRAAVTSVVNGADSNLRVVDATGNIALTCRRDGVATFDVGVGTWPKSATACGGARPVLQSHCRLGCVGVYPVRYTLQINGSRRDLWSLVTLTSGTTHGVTPVTLVAKSSPTTPRFRQREAVALQVLAQRDAKSAISLSYPDAVNVTFAPGGVAQTWRSAVAYYLSSSQHSLVPLGPAGADYGALRAVGLGTEIPRHFDVTTALVAAGTGITTSTSAVAINGPLTPRSIDAMALHGRRRILISEDTLRSPTNNGTHWGVPFYASRTTRGSLLMSTDSALSERSQDHSLEPARRVAVLIGEMALLRSQHPRSANSQGVVLNTSLRLAGPKFLGRFINEVHGSSLFKLVSLDDVFKTTSPGANGAPIYRKLIAYDGAQWQPDDIRNVAKLASDSSSLRTAFSSPQPLLRAEASRLLAEVPNRSRRGLIEVAQRQFAGELGQFSVDQSTITVTGGSSSIPVTVTSGADYAFTGILRVTSDRLDLPEGRTFPVTLSTPITTTQVPISGTSGTSAFVRITLMTADQRVVITSGTVQVRYAGASIVGYLLSGGSLLIIAWWWWRTSRRSKPRIVAP